MKRPSERTSKASIRLDSRAAPSRSIQAVDDRLPETIPPEHRVLVLQGLEAVKNGDVATEAELEAFFARYKV